MGLKFSTFRTNPKKEIEGVWVEEDDGLRLLVAAAENPRYLEEFRKLLKPYAVQFRNGSIKASILETVRKKAAAKTILLGWEGLENDDGSPIEYSSKKAFELFEESRKFFQIVTNYSEHVQLFQDQDLEEAAKNSEAALNGSSNTEKTSPNSEG